MEREFIDIPGQRERCCIDGEVTFTAKVMFASKEAKMIQSGMQGTGLLEWRIAEHHNCSPRRVPNANFVFIKGVFSFKTLIQGVYSIGL